MVNHALLQLPYVSLGFGALKSEFWLGLDKIQRPTSESNNMLRLDFEDFEENTALLPSITRLMSRVRNDKYRLICDSYSGITIFFLFIVTREESVN